MEIHYNYYILDPLLLARERVDVFSRCIRDWRANENSNRVKNNVLTNVNNTMYYEYHKLDLMKLLYTYSIRYYIILIIMMFREYLILNKNK